MVIVSFKPQTPENNNAFCSSSESNKRNARDRTLDLPFFFRYKHKTSFENHLSVYQVYPGYYTQSSTRREFALLVAGQLLWSRLFVISG